MGLLGACGCFLSGILSMYSGRIVPLKLLAFSSTVGFFLGSTAFIMALVPPFRRLMVRQFKCRVWVLAGLALVAAFLYGLEDWRGWRAWQQFRQAGETKGERYNIASFIPPR